MELFFAQIEKCILWQAQFQLFFLHLFQVDVRCHIQSLYWYHENLSGEKRLIQTARNSTEPYMYTINRASDLHRGRYFCIINNVMGQNECSAHLVLQNSGQKPKFKISVFIMSVLGLILLCYWKMVLHISTKPRLLFLVKWHSVQSNKGFADKISGTRDVI